MADTKIGVPTTGPKVVQGDIDYDYYVWHVMITLIMTIQCYVHDNIDYDYYMWHVMITLIMIMQCYVHDNIDYDYYMWHVMITLIMTIQCYVHDKASKGWQGFVHCSRLVFRIRSRVARFFLTQYTKTGKTIPNFHLITKWP
jgi:hypothetical protein